MIYAPAYDCSYSAAKVIHNANDGKRKKTSDAKEGNIEIIQLSLIIDNLPKPKCNKFYWFFQVSFGYLMRKEWKESACLEV